MTESSFNKGEITFHFLYAATYFNPDPLTCRDGITVFHCQVGSHTGGLELAVDKPSAKFIHQRRLNPSVQSLEPALIVIARILYTDNIISVLIKLHLEPVWVLRATCKAIIPLLLQSQIWVSDLLHT